MRHRFQALIAGIVLVAPLAPEALAEGPAEDASGEARPRHRVQITESSAVVHALDCPTGTQPTWQSVRSYSLLALPELELLGIGRTSVCGVQVSGVETQVILACQRANGTHHGPIGSWPPGGEKRAEGRCRNGLAHGVWRRFRPDGRVDLEGRFTNGKAAGTWTEWEPSGQKRALGKAELARSAPVF